MEGDSLLLLSGRKEKTQKTASDKRPRERTTGARISEVMLGKC